MFKFKKKRYVFQYTAGEEYGGNPKNFSVKWKMFGYLVVFCCIMLMLLWTFQVNFLSNFYRYIKTTAIENSAEQLVEVLDDYGFGTEEVDSTINKVVYENDACVLVVNLDSYQVLQIDAQSQELSAYCIIHKLAPTEIVALAREAAATEDGTLLLEINIDDDLATESDLGSSLHKRLYEHMTSVTLTDDIPESMVCVTTTQDVDGANIAILVNSTITPVDATVNALRALLLIVTAIMILVGLVISFVMSRKISIPIIQLNDASKRLARGKFDADFTATGYREIEQLGETLHYAANELGKTEQLQRDLIANISHDLRTPLTLITGYAEAMRDLPDENTPENVQVIIDEANRLTTLVNDILDLSKLQSSAITLNKSLFNLTESIAEINLRFNKLTEAQGYKLIFEPSEEIWVEADEIKISQVIYNFVNNAMTYTGDDKTVIVRQKYCAEKDLVRIEIVDSGEGIEPDKIKEIWDRYYKSDKNHKRAQMGSGIGLSIVKNVLDLHEAKYGVESSKGEGSIFWFELETI